MAPVERRDVRARAPVAVHHAGRPAALQAAAAARRGCAWAPPWSASSGWRTTARRTSARPPGRGSRSGWARRPTARSGARCCAASSAPGPTRSPWSGSGTSCGCGAGRTRARRSSAIPIGSWQPLLEALRSRIEANGGRVLIDRPAIRISHDLEVTFGASDSFRAGHDPRRVRDRRRGALRPRARHRPQRHLRPAHRPAGAADRVLRGALPAARARPPVLRRTTGPTWPTASCRSWA